MPRAPVPHIACAHAGYERRTVPSAGARSDVIVFAVQSRAGWPCDVANGARSSVAAKRESIEPVMRVDVRVHLDHDRIVRDVRHSRVEHGGLAVSTPSSTRPSVTASKSKVAAIQTYFTA